MIARRQFIAGLGSAVAWPVVARAQQGERIRRIGVLMQGDENDPLYTSRVSAFTQALASLGWTNGRNVRMDLRWDGADIKGIRALAQELVGLQPDIIVTFSTPNTIALQRETRTIPIVFADVADPVASGIVERLDRPSGNVTGFAAWEASLGGKWLELLAEIAPGLKRAAIIFNPDNAPVSTVMPSLETAATLRPFITKLKSKRPSLPLGASREAALLSFRMYLRSRIARRLSRRSRRHLCRSHSARRETGRSTGAVSGEIRDGREPQDREGTRPHCAAVHSASCRRGYRIAGRAYRFPAPLASKGCALGNCTFARAAMHSRSRLGVNFCRSSLGGHVRFGQQRTRRGAGCAHARWSSLLQTALAWDRCNGRPAPF